MKSLIKELVTIPGPSGYEEGIRKFIQSKLADFSGVFRVDNLGNLIVSVGNRQAAQSIMLAAHVDEIGVMVTHVDNAGYARIAPIGGVFPRMLPGGRVQFLNGAMGVIGVEQGPDASTASGLANLYIDLGARNGSDCPVSTGDIGVFERKILDLGERIVSKAMDDRVSVAILIELIRSIGLDEGKSSYRVEAVFTTQEEVGVRGATTAAFSVEPDIGLALDVTRCGDTPRDVKMDVSLGKGPAVKVRDQRMISDPRIVDWLVKTAEASKIPYQIEVLERGSTDARAIQLSRAGVPSGCISIPCRYIHSPSEMVDMNDVQNTLRLLKGVLLEPLKL